MDDIKAECIFNAQVHVKEEDDIKEEREWEDSAGLRGVSAAAARAGLYANHEVKEELVLGPVGVQPADVAFTLYACQASAARAQPAPRDYVVSADARQPETHVANNADVGNQVHSNADIHTEKPYVCDICNKRFALKTRLVEHVMIHMHQEPEQERIRVADNAARAPNARQHPALRDCVVRLERLVELAAGRDERLAPRAGRDTDVEKEIHGNTYVSTEEETYICDTCKMRFPRKSQLVEHVVKHIQRRESGRGSTCQASAARAQPVPRDYIVSADARRPDTHVANNADVGNQVHSNANIHTEKEPYVCDICNKSFALKTRLVEHVMTHMHQEPDQERIRVADNTARAPNARQHPALRDCVVRLERLVELAAGRDERLAPRAGRVTDIEKEIHGNTDVGTEEETYICDTCKKRFPRKSQLVEHVVKHMQRRESGRGSTRGGRGEGREPTREECRHACPICYKDFPTPSKVKTHERIHTVERPFSCGICKHTFTQLGSLKKHENIHTGQRPFSCGICQKKFTESGSLKKHERIHTGQRPFSCGICKHTFTQLGSLKTHERIHTGQKPFSCGICKHTFAQLGNLKRHERMHTGQKPFSCGICKHTFTQSGSLKTHERIHTGQRPFSCGICKHTFTRLSGLKKHERIHTGQKPFSCGICKHTFTELGSLKRHERMHTGERPFSCGICKKKFTDSGHLKRHERTHTREKLHTRRV